MIRRVFLQVALAVCASAAGLRAQTVRGSVMLGDGTTAASGVIVLAIDERGATAARTLTSERGDFVLSLPRAGRFGLQVLRIGFRPTVVAPVAIADGETSTMRIVLTAAAVPLAAVNVRAHDECRVNPDSGLAVARVWEEARKAILASQLSADGAPFYAEWIEYDRTLEANGRFVWEQHVRSSRNQTTHAFTSLPAEVLATKGYIVEDSSGTMFYAPDADVLVSPSFAALHCFRLVPPPADRPTLIGVGFEPTQAHGDVRDIEGTFWLDRNTAELRSLEFKYTNLPHVITEAGAGGTVEFLRLAGGSWLVNRWRVRLPVFGLPEHISERSRRFSVSITKAVVGAIQVTGGEVTRVVRNDITQYQASGPALRLQVVSRDPLLPAAGAMLALAGTDYVATADSTGLIALSPVLEGHYRVRVGTWLMDSLGMAVVERDVDVGAGAHVDSLALLTAREALAKLCPADSVRHGEGMLRGGVRDERGEPVKQAAVTVTWLGGITSRVTRQGGFTNTVNGIDAHEETLGVLTDDGGGWRVCGVPRGITLTARVVTDSGADSRTATLAEDQAFRAVDLVTHHDAATATSVSRALVEFAVYGNGGAPLPGATLDVTVPGGATRTVITGPGGRALMPDVTPGLLRVKAKRIGLKPGQLAVTVEAGRNTVPILLSDATMPALDTVRVVGNKITNGRLDEFETRRLRHEATASFTHEDMVKRNVVEAWQMLSGVSAVHFIPSGANGGLLLVSSRGMNVNANGAVPCIIGVMIDGMVMPGEIDGNFDMSHLPPPDQIAGMELFAGPADIPLKYGGSTAGIDKRCGLLAIWTR